MKRIIHFLAMSLLVSLFLASCDDQTKEGPGDLPAGDLEIVAEQPVYDVTIGASSVINFTITGIDGADLALTSSIAGEGWSVSATFDKTSGAGELIVTAPLERTNTIVTLKAVDSKNDRSFTKRIGVSATATGMPDISATLTSTESTIMAGEGPITLNYSVTGLQTAILIKPVLANIVANPLTIDAITYDSQTSSGTITLSCLASIISNAADVSIAVEDSYGRRDTSNVVRVSILPAFVAPIIPNSYIVAPGATKTFAAAYSRIVSAELLWQDAQSVVTAVSFSGGNISVTSGSTLGNGVVVGKNAAGAIIWSWHIWVTDYDPVATAVTIDGVIFMDRNLGATSATKGSPEAQGNQYQWGRKDPFMRVNGVAASGSAAERVRYNINNEVLEPHEKGLNDPSTEGAYAGTIESSIANPDTFFVRYITTNDWWDSALPINKDLWGGESGVKSRFDPCPDGWKVPIVNGETNPFEFIRGGTWDSTNKGVSYKADGKEIWFPVTGSRYRTTALVGVCLTTGIYYLGSFKEVEAGKTLNRYYSMSFDKSGFFNYNNNMLYSSIAASLRCVKE